MELEFELDDYVNEEHREFGAILVVEARKTKEEICAHNVAGDLQSYGFDSYEIDDARLFTYDQDGGEVRDFEVDPFEYIRESELVDRLED